MQVQCALVVGEVFGPCLIKVWWIGKIGLMVCVMLSARLRMHVIVRLIGQVVGLVGQLEVWLAYWTS